MKTSSKARNGSALVAVLGIVTVVSIVCGMLSMTASNQARGSQITRDMLKARMIAESGLNKAYCAVKGNFALANGYRLNEAFDGGSYKVSAVPLPGAAANRAQLLSEGTYGLGKVVVSADLKNIPLILAGNGAPNYYPLDCDLLVGGTLTLSGNFHSDVTLIHSNGSSEMKGSANLSGVQVTVSSAGTAAWKNKKVTDNVSLLSNRPARVIFPPALQTAINALIACAERNNAVYANAASIPFAPPGGVAYCTGSDSGWSGDGSGCFIFAGTYGNKHIAVNSVNGYPALVVLSPSSIQFNAGTTIRGALILPNSSLKFNGHAAIYGPMLIGQTMVGNGTADLYAGTSGQGFNLPTAEAEQKDNVVITAWH